MQILAAKLADVQRAERRAELDSLSGPKADVAWGSQIRSYVMAPYQMVKDLRTEYETGNVDAVLDGDIDEFIEAELRRAAPGGRLRHRRCRVLYGVVPGLVESRCPHVPLPPIGGWGMPPRTCTR